MELAVALVFDRDGLAAAILRDLLELDLGVDGLAVDLHQEVALLEASLLGGIPGLDQAELNLAALIPAGEPDADAVVEDRSDDGVDAFAATVDRDVHRTVGAGDFLESDIFPSGIRFAFE